MALAIGDPEVHRLGSASRTLINLRVKGCFASESNFMIHHLNEGILKHLTFASQVFLPLFSNVSM